MGAVFFLMFVAAIFFAAVYLILINVKIIAVWNSQKRSGKNPKKWWLVVPLILIIVGGITALFPIGFFGLLRYANDADKKPVVYAESGTILYWPMENFESTTEWFEMNGVKYVRFRTGFSFERFFLDYGDEKLEKPIANIKYDPAYSNFFNDFMWIIFSGKIFSEQNENISTVYPVKNDNNFEFYSVKNRNVTYCSEEKIDEIKAYYSNISNYDTQNVISVHTAYYDCGAVSGERNTCPHSIRREIVFAHDVFYKLHQMSDSKQNFERVEVSFDYDKRKIYAYSNDKMAYKHIRACSHYELTINRDKLSA